jgi:hypothetical protein
MVHRLIAAASAPVASAKHGSAKLAVVTLRRVMPPE